MTNVLGLNYRIAAGILEREGFTVVCTPLSSRKGVDGNDTRVIRQRILDGGSKAELICTVVKTDCSNG